MVACHEEVDMEAAGQVGTEAEDTAMESMAGVTETVAVGMAGGVEVAEVWVVAERVAERVVVGVVVAANKAMAADL